MEKVPSENHLIAFSEYQISYGPTNLLLSQERPTAASNDESKETRQTLRRNDG